MPFRTTINGLLVECDTPGELLALTKKQSGSILEGRPETSVKPLKTIKPVTPVKTVMKVKPVRIDPDRRGFVENGKRLLEALKEAYPSSLTTTRLAARLGLRNLAIPSIVMGLRSRARHEGLDFDSLVRKDEISEKGAVMSSYQITERGIEALQKYGH